MAGILRKQINRELMSHPKQNETKEYKENVIVFESQYWVVNISQLINCFMENNILKFTMKDLSNVFSCSSVNLKAIALNPFSF